MVMPILLFPEVIINSFSGLVVPEYAYFDTKKAHQPKIGSRQYMKKILVNKSRILHFITSSCPFNINSFSGLVVPEYAYFDTKKAHQKMAYVTSRIVNKSRILHFITSSCPFKPFNILSTMLSN